MPEKPEIKPDAVRSKPSESSEQTTRREMVPPTKSSPSLHPISSIVIHTAFNLALVCGTAFAAVKIVPPFMSAAFAYLDNLHSFDMPPHSPIPAPAPAPSPIPPRSFDPPKTPQEHDWLHEIYRRVNALMDDFRFMKRLKEGTLILFPNGCGGFVAAENVLVTAAHCFFDSDPKSQRDLDGVGVMTIQDAWRFSHRPYFLRDNKGMRHVIVRHPSLDVAVVVFSRPYFLKSRVLPIVERIQDTPAPVVYCGHPAGHLWDVSGGYVASRGDNLYTFFLEAYPGSSGGPVVNEKGEVISVLCGSSREMVHQSDGSVFDRKTIMDLIRKGKETLRAHGAAGHAKSKSKLQPKSKKLKSKSMF